MLPSSSLPSQGVLVSSIKLISGLSTIICQNFFSTLYKKVYLQFTQITSSSRSEEIHAQESPKMLLQALHWNTTGKLSSVFNLSTAVRSDSSRKFTAIFFRQTRSAVGTSCKTILKSWSSYFLLILTRRWSQNETSPKSEKTCGKFSNFH